MLLAMSPQEWWSIATHPYRRYSPSTHMHALCALLLVPPPSMHKGRHLLQACKVQLIFLSCHVEIFPWS